LHTAIELGVANKIVGIFMAIIENDNYGATGNIELFSVKPLILRLDPYIESLSDDEIAKVFGFLKDWNMNARFSFVSQALISSFMRVVKIEKLRNIREARDALEGLEVYSERHFQRIDR